MRQSKPTLPLHWESTLLQPSESAQIYCCHNMNHGCPRDANMNGAGRLPRIVVANVLPIPGRPLVTAHMSSTMTDPPLGLIILFLLLVYSIIYYDTFAPTSPSVTQQ